MDTTTFFAKVHIMTAEDIQAYCNELRREERSMATIKKYQHDVQAFYTALPAEKAVDKEVVLAYKEQLAQKLKSASVNTVLAAVNRFFTFKGWEECKVKFLKVQHCRFRESDKELSKPEYQRLVEAARAKKNDRLYLMIQTLCATGLRVSEHKFVTLEAIRNGRVIVYNKGKERTVILPQELIMPLLKYCERKNIKSGPVFVTRSGRPVDRSNIWADMKKLCDQAQVNPNKVFPHNLRHLFALTYYRLEKDIVRLADILGHSSVETTRVYTTTDLKTQKKLISRMGLVLTSGQK